MRLDTEQLRRQYAALSDEAFDEIDRADLVEAAQKCYDEELARREAAVAAPLETDEEPGGALDDGEDDHGPALAMDPGEEPEWLEEAACACSYTAHPGTHIAPDAELARDVLLEAGIPCYVEYQETEPPSTPPQTHAEFRVLVPGKLNLRAASVLDKEIFNQEVEAAWRTHFEGLSDEDLRALNPRVVLAGLRDRVERLTRVYQEEVARRAGR